MFLSLNPWEGILSQKAPLASGQGLAEAGIVINGSEQKNTQALREGLWV